MVKKIVKINDIKLL